jgi:hypothetical protein
MMMKLMNCIISSLFYYRFLFCYHLLLSLLLAIAFSCYRFFLLSLLLAIAFCYRFLLSLLTIASHYRFSLSHAIACYRILFCYHFLFLQLKSLYQCHYFIVLTTIRTINMQYTMCIFKRI